MIARHIFKENRLGYFSNFICLRLRSLKRVLFFIKTNLSLPPTPPQKKKEKKGGGPYKEAGRYSKHVVTFYLALNWVISFHTVPLLWFTQHFFLRGEFVSPQTSTWDGGITGYEFDNLHSGIDPWASRVDMGQIRFPSRCISSEVKGTMPSISYMFSPWERSNSRLGDEQLLKTNQPHEK